MKIFFLSLAIISLVSVSHTAFSQHSIGDLTGRWESADGAGAMEFTDGQKVTVLISGMQVPAAAYTIDFSKSPIWFDVFVAPGKTVKGLLAFEDDDTIKWQIFLGSERGYDFTDPDDNSPMILLKRKK